VAVVQWSKNILESELEFSQVRITHTNLINVKKFIDVLVGLNLVLKAS
jgi:hypothetical protein